MKFHHCFFPENILLVTHRKQWVTPWEKILLMPMCIIVNMFLGVASMNLFETLIELFICSFLDCEILVFEALFSGEW